MNKDHVLYIAQEMHKIQERAKEIALEIVGHKTDAEEDLESVSLDEGEIEVSFIDIYNDMYSVTIPLRYLWAPDWRVQHARDSRIQELQYRVLQAQQVIARLRKPLTDDDAPEALLKRRLREAEQELASHQAEIACLEAENDADN